MALKENIMDKKNIFCVRTLAYVFIISLFFSVNNTNFTASVDPENCIGVIQLVDALIVSQVQFAKALEEVQELQESMNQELATATALILTCTLNCPPAPKTLNLMDLKSKMPNKAVCTDPNACASVVRDFNTLSIQISLATYEALIADIAVLREVEISQNSSIDTLADMHTKIDSILDLLGTSTQLADELDVSLTDCEASLEDCLTAGDALWEEFMGDIAATPDDLLWSFEAEE